MSEIIEQIGDPSYPVGLIIRMGIMGATSVKLGVNVMAAIGEATHGPGMTVLPLTSESETSRYYKSGPLARAGRMGFAQGLPAGYFIRVMGEGHAAAQKNLHDGVLATETETFYGDGDEGPYPSGLQLLYPKCGQQRGNRSGQSADHRVLSGIAAHGQSISGPGARDPDVLYGRRP